MGAVSHHNSKNTTILRGEQIKEGDWITSINNVSGSGEELAARLTAECQKAGHAVLFRVDDLREKYREGLERIREALSERAA